MHLAPLRPPSRAVIGFLASNGLGMFPANKAKVVTSKVEAAKAFLAEGR